MYNWTASIKGTLHRAIAQTVGVILRPGAIYDLENFRLWENRGYHITPVHFYSPIPDTRELEQQNFQPSACYGIDFQAEHQLRLMKETFAPYAEEYNALPKKQTSTKTFYLDNGMFGGIDPHVYYNKPISLITVMRRCCLLPTLSPTITPPKQN